jgi:hypothetical protein
MINLKESNNNKRKYPYISKFIYTFLLRYKKDLPRNLKVKIYDYEDNSFMSSNFTGLTSYKLKNGHYGDYELDINLKQIFDLYTGRESFTIPGRDIPGKIKGIRNYLRFVILHELGHYKLHRNNYFSGLSINEKLDKEIACDRFAYDILQAGQLFFQWGD